MAKNPLKKLKKKSKKIVKKIEKGVKATAQETQQSAEAALDDLKAVESKTKKEIRRLILQAVKELKKYEQKSEDEMNFVDDPDQLDTHLDNFDPAPQSSYRAHNNLILSEACRVSYQSSSACKEKLANWGFQKTQIFQNNKGDFGYLAQHPDFIFMVFRGTDDLYDVVRDLQFAKKTFLGNNRWKVFQGARDSFYDLWERKNMNTALRKMHNRGQPLWISGHSLGGAIATVAAAHLMLSKQTEIDPRLIRGLVTFGQFRVFNRRLAETFDKRDGFKGRFFRYTNDKDPVVSLPPQKIFGKTFYQHAGIALDIDKKGVLRLSKDSERDSFTNHEVNDHYAEKYSQRLLQNLDTKVFST